MAANTKPPRRAATLADVRRHLETSKNLRETASHPLEASVIEVFRKRSPLDRSTLANGLASPDPWCCVHIEFGPGHPKLATSPAQAYLIVAEDVLGWMHGQGKLVKDEAGWYRLAEGAKALSEGAAP